MTYLASFFSLWGEDQSGFAINKLDARLKNFVKMGHFPGVVTGRYAQGKTCSYRDLMDLLDYSNNVQLPRKPGNWSWLL